MALQKMQGLLFVEFYATINLMKRKGDPLEINLISTSQVDFIENYNKYIPKGYPQATREALKRFQIIYPTLFKKPDMWSIDKHRKRLMDWLSTQ